jgi:hypothetical protein
MYGAYVVVLLSRHLFRYVQRFGGSIAEKLDACNFAMEWEKYMKILAEVPSFLLGNSCSLYHITICNT